VNFVIPEADLQPLVEAVVRQTVEQLQADSMLAGDGRIAVLETEAASLIGVKSHTLRDARLRGEITATKIGGRIGYEISEIRAYLARNRQE